MSLTTNQKIKVRSALHRAYSKEGLSTPWLKGDVDTAISDVDTWLDSNSASYSASLSQPFRGSSSAADKTGLLIATTIAQRLVDEPAYVAVLRSVLAELADIQGA